MSRSTSAADGPSDPLDMARRGRIGAHVTHSQHDARELTAPARAAFLAGFDAAVDPTGVLADDERRRRAKHARKAYFARLALRSAAVRRQGAAAREAARAVG